VAQFPQIHLLLAGRGSEEGRIRELADRLRITNCLTLLPAQEEILTVLEKIDIFVLPSTTEALSNSLMEAMTCGLAVIASNVGGTPELIQHGQNGLLFESNNTTDLKQQIAKLLLDAGLRRRLGEASRKTIIERFSIEQSACRMAEMYQELLEQKGVNIIGAKPAPPAR
jgi:glycosyltransferase involved in cell wall biosynthesis